MAADLTFETVLLSSEQIQQRVREMGQQIARDYPEPGDLHLICVLKGAFMFLGDLIRAIDRVVTVDFMAVSSYAKGTTSSGEVRLVKDLDTGKSCILTDSWRLRTRITIKWCLT